MFLNSLSEAGADFLLLKRLQVKPPQLAGYLRQKQAEGYTVIGVEQTARSTALAQYCFPERTLLLLG